MNRTTISHIMLTVSTVFLLSGCSQFEDDMVRATETVRLGYDSSRQRIAEYIYSEPEAIQPSAPLPATFCYQHMMDIVCYNEPQPKHHTTLVAVQGKHSYDYYDFMPEKVIEMQRNEQIDTINSAPLPPIQAHTPEPLMN